MGTPLVETATYDTDVVVGDPGDAVTSAMLKAFAQPLANRAKFFKALLDGVDISAGRYDFAAPLTITRRIDLYAFSGPNISWDGIAAGTMTLAGISNQANRGLDEYLVDGATLTQIRVNVDPGAARSGSQRVNISLFRNQFVTSGSGQVQIGSTVFDSGSSARQTLTLPTIGHVVNKGSYSYSLGIVCGVDANTNIDVVYGADLTMTVPGLRP